MTPKWFMSGFQALPLAALTVALAIFGNSTAATALAAFVGCVGFAFASVYRLQLRRRARSEERRNLEALVIATWLFVAFVSGGVGLGLALTGSGVVGQRDHVALTLFSAALVAAFTIIFTSSLGDWYFTLPRLAGVICAPPCLDPHHPRWQRLTRAWYGHRALTALFSIACFAAGAGAVIGGVIYHVLASHTPKNQTWPVVAAAFGGFVPPAFAVVVAFARGTGNEFLQNVARAASLAIYPRFSIGEYVEVRWPDGEPQTAYVLDVALEGFKIRPPSTTRKAQTIKPRSVPNRLALEGRVHPALGRYCARGRCLGLNVPYCEVWKARVRARSRDDNEGEGEA
jgi:hypothetical protein